MAENLKISGNSTVLDCIKSLLTNERHSNHSLAPILFDTRFSQSQNGDSDHTYSFVGIKQINTIKCIEFTVVSTLHFHS